MIFLTEYDEKKHLRHTFEEGKEAGIAEGEARGLIRQVCRKLAKNETPEMIAEELEEDLAVIIEICDAAGKFEPVYDCDQIYKRFCERKQAK